MPALVKTVLTCRGRVDRQLCRCTFPGDKRGHLPHNLFHVYNMRVFDSTAYVFMPKAKTSNLESRVPTMPTMGYNRLAKARRHGGLQLTVNGYRILLDDNHIEVSQDVTLNNAWAAV